MFLGNIIRRQYQINVKLNREAVTIFISFIVIHLFFTWNDNDDIHCYRITMNCALRWDENYENKDAKYNLIPCVLHHALKFAMSPWNNLQIRDIDSSSWNFVICFKVFVPVKGLVFRVLSGCEKHNPWPQNFCVH